jgi:hypothetical protein
MPPLLYEALFISGAIGVAMLFVLSGFVMGFLYPHPLNTRDFLQKRYTRIFPLFLTVSIGLLLAKCIPGNPWSPIVIVALLALCVHSVWTKKIEQLPALIKRRIFLAFLLLQLTTGVIYMVISQNSVILDALKQAGATIPTPNRVGK